MAPKTAGKLHPPPSEDDFKKLPLRSLGRPVTDVFYRLHGTKPKTDPGAADEAWPPIYFSRQGRTRFDPADGVGTLYLGYTLPGAIMELFDDRWGQVGSPGRSLTKRTLRETWVTRVSVLDAHLFDGTGGNLSLIGTDGQLVTGEYSTTREWALRMMEHPDQIGGILFRSRHDLSRINAALFQRDVLLPEIFDPDLLPFEPNAWKRSAAHGNALVYGPAMRLSDHPDLNRTLNELSVALLP
jgi:hypothetical protein